MKIDNAWAHIAQLAERYPRLFTRDKWLPQKPLKIGIAEDLKRVAADIDANCLALYTGRYQYQTSIITNKWRFDLRGNPTTEITPEEKQHAQARLDAHIAKDLRLREEAKAKRVAARNAAKLNGKPPVRTKQVHVDTNKRLSLADLKAAAQLRREAQQ